METNDSFLKHVSGKLQQPLDAFYMKSGNLAMKIFASYGIAFLLTKNVIAPYLSGGFFVIAGWFEIVVFYVVCAIVGFVIYALSELLMKILLWIMH